LGMNPNDVSNMYADSPERMLYLSLLLLAAVALFMLWNRRESRKGGMYRTASPAELPAPTTAARGPWSQAEPFPAARPAEVPSK
jgi:hypothetical protein